MVLKPIRDWLTNLTLRQSERCGREGGMRLSSDHRTFDEPLGLDHLVDQPSKQCVFRCVGRSTENDLRKKRW
jgi:hypothetical protein